MNYRELTRRLKNLNCVLDRHAKGSHDLKHGIVSGILKDLDIRKEDFDKLSH
ncbi:MAG: hypothetical protein WCF70_00800 [Dehalococcoidales bacterium]|jgi:hypothetical protein